MPSLTHKIKTLYANKSSLVLCVASEQTPDIFAQKLCQKLSKHHTNLKRVILICHFHFQHKRLTQKENLDVVFLIQNSTDQSNFIIKKICIQNNTNQKSEIDRFKSFHNFHAYYNMFKGDSEHKIVFTPNNVFQLIPVFIPKPWGQEIWYSGIESRGVAGIDIFKSSSKNMSINPIPLSWIVGAVPSLIFGKKFAHKDPILMKILDPLPKEVIGDLYYELHLEKNEVYVVTDVTAKAGGKIKIGINQEKLGLYHNNKTLYKQDFLKNILEYEKVRRTLDQLNDEKKQIPPVLYSQENALRKKIDSFCGFVDLKIGDVINVPTYTPHALQHGVKVIEFQTPTYERLIISFAQKVLTQSHWDTKRAFDLMHLEAFQKQKLKILSKTKHMLKELVCSFADFCVSRWTVDADKNVKISKKSHYQIVFMVTGSLAEKCILIPAHQHFNFTPQTKSVFLVCTPIHQ